MYDVDIELLGAPTFVYEVGADGAFRLVASNAANVRAIGRPIERILGCTVADILPAETAARVDALLRECAERKAPLSCDEDFETDDGLGWWRLILTPQLSEGGRVIQIVGVAFEITERKRVEADLQNAAFTDAVTGIANRRRFDIELAAAVRSLAERDAGFGLILVDLDGFKQVNDTFGHRKGDDVLRHVASLLTLATREGECVARVGGDEFALIVSARSATELRTVAASLGQLLDRSFNVAEVEARVGASIGSALCAPGHTPIDLFVIADAAMYADKARRRAASRALIGG